MKPISVKSTITALAAIAALSACQSEDPTDAGTAAQPDERHTCEMIFNGSRYAYDDEPAASSRSAAQWEEGDKIYLSFSVGSKSVQGEAEYSSGKWYLSYTGTLTSDSESKCNACYIDGIEFEAGASVKLNPQSTIYSDSNGKYIYSNGTLSVTANLAPSFGRVRFKGNANDSIKIIGINTPSYFNPSNMAITFTNSYIATKINDTGYTDYIVGSLDSSADSRINLVTPQSGFYRTLSSDILAAGKSGYISVPTTSSKIGWKNYLNIYVKGVDFIMLPVELDDGSIYFMGETELTEQQYSVTSSSTKSSTYPKSYASYSDFSSFISSLNALTGVQFRFPTAAEWLFAAKGGLKSKGYKYAGSNNIDDVAWYSGNCSSDQGVKQKQPNELGFYDMSGNVEEMVENKYAYGGSYYTTAAGCYISSSPRSVSSSAFKYVGMRLALSF